MAQAVGAVVIAAGLALPILILAMALAVGAVVPPPDQARARPIMTLAIHLAEGEVRRVAAAVHPIPIQGTGLAKGAPAAAIPV